jgi:hypothetical protein
MTDQFSCEMASRQSFNSVHNRMRISQPASKIQIWILSNLQPFTLTSCSIIISTIHLFFFLFCYDSFFFVNQTRVRQKMQRRIQIPKIRHYTKSRIFYLKIQYRKYTLYFDIFEHKTALTLTLQNMV